MKKRLIQIISRGTLTALALTLALLSAQAEPAATPVKGPRASALAQAHWRAIAAGDVTDVMAGYDPDPILHWDGGAFDGDHVGAPAIETVWNQFARLRAPLQVQVSDLSENRGNEGSRIVTAYVVFTNHVWTYDVVYRLVFRQGQIVDETWRLAGPGDGPAINEPA
jgi:hypothetical protein